jgi:hypothetical protein
LYFFVAPIVSHRGYRGYQMDEKVRLHLFVPPDQARQSHRRRRFVHLPGEIEGCDGILPPLQRVALHAALQRHLDDIERKTKYKAERYFTSSN